MKVTFVQHILWRLKGPLRIHLVEIMFTVNQTSFWLTCGEAV